MYDTTRAEREWLRRMDLRWAILTAMMEDASLSVLRDALLAALEADDAVDRPTEHEDKQ